MEKRIISRKKAGSITIEASWVMIFVLAVILLVIRTGIHLQQEVSAEAELWQAEEESRYDKGIQPVDLIRAGQFMEEWIPDSKEEQGG